jgi:hypothetical protein
MPESANDIRRRATQARRLADTLTGTKATTLRDLAVDLDRRASEIEKLAMRTATNVEITTQVTAELKANIAIARRLRKKPKAK